MKRIIIFFIFLLLTISFTSCETGSNDKYKQEQDKLEKQLDERRRSKIEEKENLERQIDSLKREKEKKAEELKILSEDN